MASDCNLTLDIGHQPLELDVCFKPFSLLLDSFTHTPRFAGWTGGKLRTAYTGPIIRIRRGSDNAEINVDAVAGVTDTAAIAAHCAGTAGYLVTLYDQSGNGNDITQPDSANQPVIYESGSPVLGEDGYLAVKWDENGYVGQGQFLYSAGLVGSATADHAATLWHDMRRTRSDYAYFIAGLVYPGNEFPGYQIDDGLVTEIWLPDTSDNYAEYYIGPPWSGTEEGLNAHSPVIFDMQNPLPGDVRSVFISRAAGQQVQQTVVKLNGITQTMNSDYYGPGSDVAQVAQSQIVYGLGQFYPGGCITSGMIYWEHVLSADEYTALTEWEAEHAL